MHPAGPRCSSLTYARYARSSRLAGRAPRRPRCQPYSDQGPKRLDRGEYDFRIRILDVAGVMPEPRIRADAAEGVERLVQNLFPVRDEQHAAELRPARVERREPGLAEPGRQDDQARLVAGGSRVVQRSQGRLLDLVRLHGRLRSLPLDIRGFDDGALEGAALAIAFGPRGVERPGVRMSARSAEARCATMCGSRGSSPPVTSLIRGASPLGLPDTLSRAPLRRRAPFAWLTRWRSFADALVASPAR